MLRYKIAPKCLLPGPFGHSDVGGNPGVAGRFVAIISFLHTPVSLGTREGVVAAVDFMLKILQWFPLVSPITFSRN